MTQYLVAAEERKDKGIEMKRNEMRGLFDVKPSEAISILCHATCECMCMCMCGCARSLFQEKSIVALSKSRMDSFLGVISMKII